MKCIAIIPARSGSKGLKDKNIKDLCGKPLIAHSIEAAQKSGCFDTVMVSTDSEKYAEISRKYGAEVPFLRSAKASSDNASSWDVVREVLSMYSERGESYDVFALLQPTAPLRTAEDIISGFDLMKEKKAAAIISVCEAEHSLSLYNTLPEDHSFTGFIKDPSKYARQMNDTYFRLNGAIYISSVEHFLTHNYIGEKNCFALIMPTERSIDIDSESDFAYASFVLSRNC